MVPNLAPQAALIVGLGKTGRAAQRFFEREGRPTLLYDDKQPGCLHSPDALNWSAIQCVVPSPGIPFQHPLIREAQARGIDVWSDMDLFAQAVRRNFPGALFIGITGTNGKSTTTALIGHLLKEHFSKVIVGGNIGTPVLDLSLCEAIYVLELSSFQLAWSHPLHLNRAVWTNLTEDHLDRHGSMAAYGMAKQKIFDGAQLSILGVDDEPSRTALKELQMSGQTAKSVSTTEAADVQVLSDGMLCMDGHSFFNIAEASSLPGRHNAQNIALATATAYSLGLSVSEIMQALKTFKGLPHRIELVRTSLGGLEFINDSKATNAVSTIQALESFRNASLYLIAGGRAKSDGLVPAIPFMKSVRKVFLIGEASNRFASELQNFPKAPPFEKCQNLEKALTRATEVARQDKTSRRVILFSPACASFDQFNNFEERGDAFRQLVLNLKF